ncbi:MAG: tetratricopeptide repeat protein [Chloroflexota bacterium]
MPIQIRLLGPPQIQVDEQLIRKIGSQKSLALLGYLLCHPQAHSRSTLAGLLWLDKPESDARRNLRWALGQLNKVLPTCFEATRHTISFEPTSTVWLDVSATDEFLTRKDVDSLTQAVELYQGEFMAGLTLDDCPELEMWLLQEREAWRMRVTQTLETLVNHYAEEGMYDESMKLALRLLELEPWREEAHQQLMWLLATTGQRTAAISQFESCVTILERELGVEPTPQTIELYDRVRAGQIGSSESIQPVQLKLDQSVGAKQLPPAPDALVEQTGAKQVGDSSSTPPNPTFPLNLGQTSASSPFQALGSRPTLDTVSYGDWGEAPEIETLFGREEEIALLEHWILIERAQLVAIVGMGGLGKTSLTARVVHTIHPRFDFMLWRSLVNAPPLAEILRNWIQILSNFELESWPDSLDEQFTLLFDLLRRNRCLLILDNFESILQADDQASLYKPGYEPYGQLVANFGETRHRSSLLLTSRECPMELSRIELSRLSGDRASGQIAHTPKLNEHSEQHLQETDVREKQARADSAPIVEQSARILRLDGLNERSGHEILSVHGVRRASVGESDIVAQYSGNPLALKLVAQTVIDLFQGNMDAFVADGIPIFEDIRTVLEQQFARLLQPEIDLLLWLVAAREELPANSLRKNLSPFYSHGLFIDALRSLQRRLLLEQTEAGFTLQNVVMEHGTNFLVDQICHEIETGDLRYLKTHPLLNPLAKEYVCRSQRRLLLQPIIDRLLLTFGRPQLEAKFAELLVTLRAMFGGELDGQACYASGNILNILVTMGVDLSGYDFSDLVIWKADLRHVQLHNVNFANANLSGSGFADAFGLVHAVAFSPGGQLLAATAEKEIRLWQEGDGQIVGICQGHHDDVWSVAFSPDGQTLISGSWDQTVRLWDVASCQPLQIYKGHTKGVVHVAFSPDGQHFASAGYDTTLCIWSVDSPKPIYRLNAHESWVWGVEFSPDGQLLASASGDGTVGLWAVETGQLIKRLHGDGDQIWSVAFHPEGDRLAFGGNSGDIFLWPLSSEEKPRILKGHRSWVRTLKFSPDGRLLVSGANNGTIRLWDPVSGHLEKALDGHVNAVNSVAISRSGRTLASGSNDQTIRFWALKTGQHLRTIYGVTTWVRSVTFSQAGQQLVCGGDDRNAYLWNLATHTVQQTFSGHTQMVRSVAINSTDSIVATASADKTVRLWDVESGEVRHVLMGHTNWVSSVEFSPDGTQLVTSSWDQSIRLWDVLTGAPILTITGHEKPVYTARFSPDGTLLASGSSDHTIRLWDVATGRPPSNLSHVLTGHTDVVRHLYFFVSPSIAHGSTGASEIPPSNPKSPGTKPLLLGQSNTDALYLVSASEDGRLVLWDLALGQSIRTLSGHTRGVRAVAAILDGKQIISGGDDTTVCIWNGETGELLHAMSEHTDVIWDVAFHPDGQSMASCSSDGTTRLWDSHTGQSQSILHCNPQYKGMIISGVAGITHAQQVALKTLGAIETDMQDRLVGSSTIPEALTGFDAKEHVRGRSLFEIPARIPAQGQDLETLLHLDLVTPRSTALHNLPSWMTRLIGREEEVRTIVEALQKPTASCVTLLGPGGVGKSRLAAACGEALLDEFEHGVWFVSLAGVSADVNPSLKLGSTAGSTTDIGVSAAGNGRSTVEGTRQGITAAVVRAIADTVKVKFSGSVEPTRQLIQFLQKRSLLLVLDNFEHLKAASLLVSQLLTGAPNCKILITSRVALQLRQEQTVTIHTLAVPPLQGQISKNVDQFSSIALFIQCAQQIQPDFRLDRKNRRAVIKICCYVDGLPLGIELATSWLNVLNCQEIASEIHAGLDFFQTERIDLPERHQTMRTIFDYSWRLLSPKERLLAAQVSLFQGGFTHQASQSITGATLFDVTKLFQKSLLSRSASGRYEMHELLRQYCEEKLAGYRSGSLYESSHLYAPLPVEDAVGQGVESLREATSRRYSSYYLEFVCEMEPMIRSKAPQTSRSQLQIETDNIRQAWLLAVEQASSDTPNVEQAGAAQTSLATLQRALPSVKTYYMLAGLLEEGAALIEQTIRHLARGQFSAQTSTSTSPLDFLSESLSTSTTIYIRYDADENAPSRSHLICDLLIQHATFLNGQAHYDRAISVAQNALELATSLGATILVAGANLCLGEAYWFQGDIEGAQPLLEEAQSLASLDGNPYAQRPRQVKADALGILGSIAVRRGDYAQAIAWYEECVHLSRSLDDGVREGRVLHSLGGAFRNQGQMVEATKYLSLSLQIAQQMEEQQSASRSLNSLGDIAVYHGHFETAHRYYAQVAEIARLLGDRRGEAIAATNLGIVARDWGAYDDAQVYLRNSIDIAREIGFLRGEGWSLCCLSLSLHQQGDSTNALPMAKQAVEIFEKLGDQLGETYSLTTVGRSLLTLGDVDSAQEVYERALAFRQSLGQRHLEMEVLAGLASIDMARANLNRLSNSTNGPSGRPEKIDGPMHPNLLEKVDTILAYALLNPELAGAEEPLRIYLTCFEVLQLYADPRAERVLGEMHKLMQTRADFFEDNILRSSYIENIHTHRAIMAHWEKSSKS